MKASVPDQNLPVVIRHFRQLLNGFNDTVDVFLDGAAFFEELVMEKTGTDFLNQLDQTNSIRIRFGLFVFVGLCNLTDDAKSFPLFYAAQLLEKLFRFFVEYCWTIAHGF